MDLTSVCSGLAEKACSVEISHEFRPIFIVVWFAIGLLFSLKFVWMSKWSKKGKVFWLTVATDVAIVFLSVFLYLLLPFLIRLFNIVKIAGG